MPAVCSGCYRRPCVIVYYHLLDAANVRQFFIRARKKMKLQCCNPNFCGKHVPGNTKTGTYLRDMYPKTRNPAHFRGRDSFICAASPAAACVQSVGRTFRGFYSVGSAANAVGEVVECAFQLFGLLWREAAMPAIAVNAVHFMIEPRTASCKIGVRQFAPRYCKQYVA